MISIIIPCYNVEKYVERCFDSLIHQTIGFDKMELIFINDASTDATLDLLMGFEEKYPDNIIVINFQENQKQGTARNVGMKYASTPYIAFVDADDWVEPDMYLDLTNLMQRYDCDFIECGWNYVNNNMNYHEAKYWGESRLFDLNIIEDKIEFIRSKVALVTPCDKLYKKEFLERNDIYFPERILMEDIFFVYLLFTYASSCYYTDKVYYHYYVNDDGTCRQKKADYQFDKMNVSLNYLSECMNRDIYPFNPTSEKESVDKQSIDWMFLEKYYVYMLWEVFEEFPDKSFEVYLQMKKVINEYIPDYKNNLYRLLPGNEFDNIMIKLLEHDLDEGQLIQLRNQMLEKFRASDARDF